MKYERISTVPLGRAIPDEDQGYTVKVSPENLSDEMTLKQEAIIELETEAITGINAIIAKVEAATGRTLKGVKHVEAMNKPGKKFHPKMKQPVHGELRAFMYALGRNVHDVWVFDNPDAFLEWAAPIVTKGYYGNDQEEF